MQCEVEQVVHHGAHLCGEVEHTFTDFPRLEHGSEHVHSRFIIGIVLYCDNGRQALFCLDHCHITPPSNVQSANVDDLLLPLSIIRCHHQQLACAGLSCIADLGLTFGKRKQRRGKATAPEPSYAHS